jgi:hypothetical protein
MPFYVRPAVSSRRNMVLQTEGGAMAKFTIEFTGPISARGMSPESEVVTADRFIDHPPFVDFQVSEGSGMYKVVARYRADDIRKITRED